jgi:hypothetical protein
MNSSQNSPVDPWFKELIQTCLASLYLLSLDGCPAADQVGNTSRLWVRLLWDKPRSGWVQQLDDPRIRQAFASIAETCKRWPSPAVFWDHLPKRPEPKRGTAIGPGWGRERQREADEARDRWLAELGYDAAGNRIESAA